MDTACNRYVGTKAYETVPTLCEVSVPNVRLIKLQNYVKTELNEMNVYGYELGSWIELGTKRCDFSHNKWSDRILTVWATVSFLRKTQVLGVTNVNV
jgi:hypothetical protein